MFEFDETIEQGAIIRVIGVGEFGLKAVIRMVSNLHNVECLGVVREGYIGSGTMPLVSLSLCSDTNYDYTPLFHALGTPDLVFVVADPYDDEFLLKNICSAMQEVETLTFLVIPEQISSNKDNAVIRSKCGEDSMVSLDGVIIVSKSSIEPPYPNSWNVHGSSDLDIRLLQHSIQLITDPVKKRTLPPFDFADVKSILCGGVLNFGVGTVGIDEDPINAAEKAATCLIKQGVKLQKIIKSAVTVYSKSISMNEYNLVNDYILQQVNDKCINFTCVICGNNLPDYHLVNFISVQELSGELKIPHWIRISTLK